MGAADALNGSAAVSAVVRARDATGEDCGRLEVVELPGFRLTSFLLGEGYRRDGHAHERAGIVLVVDGRYEAAAGKRSVDASPGRAGILPAGFAHAERAGGGPTRCLLLEPSGDPPLTGLDSLLGTPRTLGDARAAALAGSLWWGLEGEHAPAAPATGDPPVWLEADAVEVVLRLHSSDDAVGRGLRGAPPPWVGRAVERLRYGPEPASLASLAHDAGVSREHLARTFRRYTGCTVGEFLRRTRLLRATRALRESSLPLSRVAFAAGFADQSHMTRLFRRYLRVTPQVYRARRGQR